MVTKVFNIQPLIFHQYYLWYKFGEKDIYIHTHDPLEIILIFWFGDYEKYIIIINVENSVAYIFVKKIMNRNFQKKSDYLNWQNFCRLNSLEA